MTRRVVQSAGFEGGLTLSVPSLMAYRLDVPLLDALVADLGLLAFLFVYTIVFTWAFDTLFGSQQSQQPAQ